MKITKARLQQIIKEEISATIREKEEPEQLELPFNIKNAQLAAAAENMQVPLEELKAVVDPDGSASLEELGRLLDDTMYKANRMMSFEEKYDVSTDERFATMGQYMMRILRGEGLNEGVVDMDGETIVTGPDGDASPLARAGARQDDLQATMLKAAMEIKNNHPQKAYETLLRALAAAGMDEKYLGDFLGYGELEEAATDYHKFIDQGYSQATAQAMASGNPAKKAEYDKLRKQGYSDSQARRFVYGRSYSAMGRGLEESGFVGSYDDYDNDLLQAATEDLIKKAEFENSRGRLKDEELNDIKKMVADGMPAREIRIKKRLKF